MAQDKHMLSINIGDNNAGSGNIDNSFNTTVNIFDEDEQIMHWLSPLEPNTRYQGLRTHRFAGVGDWLLNTREWREWRGCEGGANKAILFCSGDPGVGKTYLCSLVVDSLCDQAKEEDIAVASIYYDFLAQQEQTITNAMGSILKQLVGKGIPWYIRDAFQEAKGAIGGGGLQHADLMGMLRIAIGSLRRVFICIDALDECLPKHLPELLNSLGDIVQESPTTRIFLTGRPHIREDIQRYFKVVVIPISTNKDDVRNYLEMRLDKDVDPEAMNHDLRADIVRIILEKISDIFLLVSLNVDAILGEITIRQRRKRLEQVERGNGLGDAYTATLARLKAQARNESMLGLNVLMWVLYSQRPLRTEELRHALGVEIGSADLDSDNVAALRRVLASCLGLVTHEESSSTVRLVHFTLREHLSSDPMLFHSPHSTIAEVCLTYLNFRQVQNLSPNLHSAPSTMPLLEYAACYWGEHARRGMTENVKGLALKLLDRFDEHISAQLLLLHYNQTRSSGPYFDSARGPTGFTGLHGVIFLGIAEIVATVLKRKEWDVNAADCMGSTALTWAIRGGQDETVKLLLEREEIDPNMADTQDGQTPLTLAIRDGYEELVKMLLERQDINPNTAGTQDGRTPLLWAIRLGHEKVVKALLGREDINADQAGTQCGRTPLSLAAECGREGVVKMLLKRKDVRATTPDKKNQTPLSLALFKRHDGVVKILMERDNVNSGTGDRPFAGDGDKHVRNMWFREDDPNTGAANPDGRAAVEKPLAREQAVRMSVSERPEENSVPTGQQISEWLKNVIITHRKGLQKMYGETETELDKSLEVPIRKGEEMVRKLVTMGCNIEVAKNLTLLTLYDVSILIDDSDSMIFEENGARKEILIKFVDHITEIYSMANESGILAMRFLNDSGGKKSWTGKSQEYLDRHTFNGVTKIGTELKKKILDQFVIGNRNQSKPLLVLIVTDGAVVGEKKGHLKKVIQDCVDEREEAGKGRDAVSFLFSRIGNDPLAAELLENLDRDPDIREYIGVLPVEFDLERQLTHRWFVLPKISLGAMLPDAILPDAILPDARPPHLNSLTQPFANIGEQREAQGDHSHTRIEDRPADKEKGVKKRLWRRLGL